MRIPSEQEVQDKKIRDLLIRRYNDRSSSPSRIRIEEGLSEYNGRIMTSNVNDRGERISYYVNKDELVECTWSDLFMITPIVEFSEIADKVEDLEPIKDEEGNEIGIKTFTYGEAPAREVYSKETIIKKLNAKKVINTGQKYVIGITKEGKKYEASIFEDTETGEKYLIFVNENNEVRLPSIFEIISNSSQIRVIKFEPITWYLDEEGKYAIPQNLYCFGEFKDDYASSPLGRFLESDDFLAQIGLQKPKTIEVEEVESPIKSIFSKGKQEHLKLDEKIRRVLVGGKRVPYLVGHPGIGKTQIVKSLSKNVLYFNVSTFTPDAFTGKTGITPGKEYVQATSTGTVKTTEKGTTFVTKPEWYIKLEELSNKCRENNERCILFFDEFDKLTPNMQIFINGIVDDPRSVAGWVIPDNVDIILAGNTEEYSQASIEISGEVASRLTRIEVEPDIYDWLEWAAKNRIDPIVLAYLHLNPGKLLLDAKTPTGDYDYAKSLTPRSWDQKINEAIKAGRMYSEFPDLKDIMPEEEIPQFVSFVELYCSVNIESMLNGDYSIISSIKNNPQSLYLILNCLVPLLYTEEQLEGLFEMFAREEIPAEYIQNFKLMWLRIFRNVEDVQRLRLVEEEYKQSEVVASV